MIFVSAENVSYSSSDSLTYCIVVDALQASWLRDFCPTLKWLKYVEITSIDWTKTLNYVEITSIDWTKTLNYVEITSFDWTKTMKYVEVKETEV